MRTRVSRRFVIVLLLCACRPGICQTKNTSEEDRRGRPLQEYIQEFFLSDAVRCQEKGEWQLTAGVDSRQHIGTSSVLRTEYGLTNRLQLSAEVPYGLNEEETLDTRSRWSTVSLGIDYQIIRSSTPFALSVGMSFGVPVRSLSEIEYEPTILMAKSFHKLQVHASFVADVEEEKPSIQYNLASIYPLRRNWFPTLEFNGRSLHGIASRYATPGVYRHLAHRMEIGLGFPVGVGGRAGRLGAVGKLSWEFGSDHDTD